MKKERGEQQVREDSFAEVAKLMRELDVHVDQVLEIMFRYRSHDRELQLQDERLLTREYKMGVLDPGAVTTKYEREIAYRRRKEAML